MKEEIKKLWVAALRSGEFEQTVQSLRDDFGMCCLGVACELYRRSEGGSWTSDGEFCPPKGKPKDLVLPPKVKTWLGTGNEEGGKVRVNGVMNSLAYWNDNGLTFPEIADLIEAQL